MRIYRLPGIVIADRVLMASQAGVFGGSLNMSK